jgi:DNA-directed RNA polymerase subunit M/transcription elongation factor TFIIS
MSVSGLFNNPSCPKCLKPDALVLKSDGNRECRSCGYNSSKRMTREYSAESSSESLMERLNQQSSKADQYKLVFELTRNGTINFTEFQKLVYHLEHKELLKPATEV